MEKQTVFQEDKNDGTISIAFSEKDIEVWADFTPPIGNGKHISPTYISLVLEKFNIVYGIRMDIIQDTAMQCNLEGKQFRDVLIAKGDLPVEEVSEYYQMNPHLKMPPPPNVKNGNIDYHTYSPFVIVKKGQALAKFRYRKEGKTGKNVHGEEIPYGIKRPEGVQPGANTHIEERLILSNINGQLAVNGNVLDVQDSLVIKGAVGYSTGNIIFPGNVFIDGPVSDGFKIYSGGSVTIKQTFDVTDVVTKEDLIVGGGIIGRGPALVKVGGCLKTKFIENCHVAARKSISVDTLIINSNVFTMERLDVGEKGRILGGDIYAVQGLKAGGIGKKSGKRTHIHCGIDFTAQQEKQKNNSMMRILAIKIAGIHEVLERSELIQEKRAKLEELLHRLEDERQKASAKVAELMGRIDVNQDAVVEVLGEIAPGTLIEICQVALFVSEPLKKVRIRLEKSSGKLISEPL
ncbi:MAG: FapA family protein [Treponema sp.]|nr:FapA family protein [Treponema sp.]